MKEELLNIQKEYPVIGDVRAVGFHIGIEFVKDPETKEPDLDGCKKMVDVGYKNGIIFVRNRINKD